MIRAYFAVSARMNAANCSGVLPPGSAPTTAQPLLDFGQREDLDRFGVQLRDDGLVHRGRRDQAPPRAHVESGHARFADRWNVRKQRRALGGGHGQGAQPALAGRADDDRHRVEIQLDVTGDEIDEGRPAALVGDMHHVHLGLQLEQFRRQVLHTAAAGRGVVQLSGACLGKRDQFIRILNRERGVDHQQVRPDRRQRDRGKIPRHIISQLGIKGGQDRHGGDVPHHHCIAVGRRLGGKLGRDHAGCSATVLRNDLLPQIFGELLGDDPPDDVGASTRRKADQHPDRPGRVLLRGCGVGERGKSEQRGQNFQE